VAAGRVGADLSAGDAIGDGLPFFELYGIDTVYIQKWSQA
jgi:hypothetical protein